MSAQRIRVLVRPAVEAPRGALWAADAAAWLYRTVGAPFRNIPPWNF